MKRSLALLRARNFALLFGARSVSYLGNAMAPVALAFAILKLTGSASDLGLVLAARTIPQIGFLLVGGVLADRLPRHVVLVGSNLVAGAAQALAALLLITGAAELWQIVLLEAVNGAASALFSPANAAVVPLTIDRDRLQDANAILRIGTNLSLIGGAALAGVLVAAVNPGWTIAIDAATFLIAAVLAAGMRGIEASATAVQSALSDLIEGWHEFTSHRWLWAVVVQFAFVIFAFGGYNVLGPVVAERHLDGARSWAAILGAESAGAFLGGFVALRWHPARPMLVASLAIFLMALPVMMLALTWPTVIVAAFAVLLGAGSEVFIVYWYTTLYEHVAPAALARVNSYVALGSLALSPVGSALAGPMADWLGVSNALWIDAAIIVVATAAVLTVPEIRNLRSERQPSQSVVTAPDLQPALPDA